ncbi:MAG: HI0074 family nucleotidyltransferase substrate-binding subunit [bacterium]
MCEQNIKWQQKFDNLTRSYNNLKIAKSIDTTSLDCITEAGIIKTYELTYELLWKTIKAYLEYEGYKEIIKGSRDAFKGAYHTKIIENIDFWLLAITKRNTTTHQYHQDLASDMLYYIQEEFFQEMSIVYNNLLVIYNEFNKEE